MSDRGLKPDERLRVAFAHLCLGVDQHSLAAVFGVNAGRVAEAVGAARAAFGFKERGHERLADGQVRVSVLRAKV